MTSPVMIVIDNLQLPPEQVVGSWIPPEGDEVEAKVVKRGRPRKVNTTEGVETK